MNLKSFQQARQKIQPYIVKTPLIECRDRVFLKLENRQKTNSFKARGAFHALLNLSEEEKKRGVVARSSGNFAQALALAAHTLNVKATIVMPINAPEIKKRLTAQYHPEIIHAGTTHDEGNIAVQKLIEERGLHFISPYNQIEVIEGQGTIALEVYEELPTIRHFFCPIGGGGLMSGCAAAFKLLNSSIEVIGIEPEGAADYFQSRQTGHPVRLDHPQTIADGLRANEVGSLNRPILDKYVDQVVTITDENIKRAMKFVKEKLDMVIEPSGATALASLLYGSHKLQGDTVCVITGANVDPIVYEQLINEVSDF